MAVSAFSLFLLFPPVSFIVLTFLVLRSAPRLRNSNIVSTNDHFTSNEQDGRSAPATLTKLSTNSDFGNLSVTVKWIENLFGVKTEDAKLEASLNVKGLFYMISARHFIVDLYIPC